MAQNISLIGRLNSNVVYVGGEGTGFALEGVTVGVDLSAVSASRDLREGAPITVLGSFELTRPASSSSTWTLVVAQIVDRSSVVPAGQVRITGALRMSNNVSRTGELSGVTIELDPGDLREKSRRLDGKRVAATGDFSTVEYVERGIQSVFVARGIVDIKPTPSPADDRELLEDCVIVGTGGGFTGEYSEYTVTRRGRLYVRRGESREPFRSDNADVVRATQQLFDALDSLDFNSVPAGDAENYGSWLEFRTPVGRRLVHWGLGEAPAPIEPIMSMIVSLFQGDR